MFYSDEDFVSFDVAKLAAKKGFSFGSERFYNSQTKNLEINECKNNQIALYINGWAEGLYEAPTYATLKKWLYEKHKIYLEIIPVQVKNCNSLIFVAKIWKWIKEINNYMITIDDNNNFHISEKACMEDSMIKCLELI